MMVTCKACLHLECCEMQADYKEENTGYISILDYSSANRCVCFRNKANFVELPCRIGDTVYCITNREGKIVEDVIADYDIWSIKKGIKVRISLQNYKDYVVGEFGKDVFITREDAETERQERMRIND